MSNQYQTGAVTSLEQVFLSEQFGRSHLTRADEVPPAVLWPDNAVLTALTSVLRESNRHRAIAAVSGIAAAAMVVAGLASGGAQHVRGVVSAEAPRTGPRPFPGSGSGPSSGLSTVPMVAGGTLATSSGPAGTPPLFLTGVRAPTGQGGPPPAVTVVVPPGTNVTVVPSSATPKGGLTGSTGAGSGSSAGSPAPTPPVVIMVGNTVTTAGAAVTTTTNQIASRLSAVQPATGALGGVGATGALGGVGASVTGLGQGLNSTTS